MPDSTLQACSQLKSLHACLPHLCKLLYMLCRTSSSNMLMTASGWTCTAVRSVEQSIVLAMLAVLPRSVRCTVPSMRTSAESAELKEPRSGRRTHSS